jgi:hypothetical protein
MNNKTSKYDRLLWVLTAILVLIGIAIVVRRLLFLSALRNYVPGVTQSRSPVPDAGFAEHPLLTFIHIVPGLLFMLLAPLQLSKKIRSQYPNFQRVAGSIVLACGLIIGCTALVMGFIMAIGGITETLAVAVFGTAFLFSIIKAWIYLRKREMALYRQWMIRVVAIGLAVSTTRPVVALFFATSRLTGLTVQQYFGVAFWIAFTLHVIVAETWIRYTTKKTIMAT